MCRIFSYRGRAKKAELVRDDLTVETVDLVLKILLLHRCVYYVQEDNSVEYFLTPETILLRLRYPHMLRRCFKVFPSATEALVLMELLLLCGRQKKEGEKRNLFEIN